MRSQRDRTVINQDQPGGLMPDLKDIPEVRHMVWVLADQGRWVVPVLDLGRAVGLVQAGLVRVDFQVGLVQVAAGLNSVVPVDQDFMVRAGN